MTAPGSKAAFVLITRYVAEVPEAAVSAGRRPGPQERSIPSRYGTVGKSQGRLFKRCMAASLSGVVRLGMSESTARSGNERQPKVIGPTLETERLILRPPTKDDFEPWAALLADPAAAQFLGGPQTLSDAW